MLRNEIQNERCTKVVRNLCFNIEVRRKTHDKDKINSSTKPFLQNFSEIPLTDEIIYSIEAFSIALGMQGCYHVSECRLS